MRAFRELSFFISILTFTQLAAAGAPNDDLLQRYVNTALSLNSITLNGKGPVHCMYAFDVFPAVPEMTEKVTTLYADGHEVKEITQRLALNCIKQYCPYAGLIKNKSVSAEVLGTPAQLKELMQAQGSPPEEIEQALRNREQYQPQQQKDKSCLELEPSWGSLIAVSCLSTPIVCH